MIDELHVRTLALICDASLSPAEGLTVLTGETGAGKSALLSAIKLLVGERSSGDAVRDGADALSVEGRFFLRGQDEEFPDGQRGVPPRERRGAQPLHGRRRHGDRGAAGGGAGIDGRPVRPARPPAPPEPREPPAPSRRMGRTGGQRGARRVPRGVEGACRGGARARRRARRAQRGGVAGGGRAIRAGAHRRGGPPGGGVRGARGKPTRLRNASSLAEAANGAYEALSGDGGIIDALGEVVSSLQEVSGYDAELEGMAGTLGELVFPLEDASRDLRRYRDNVVRPRGA